MVPKQHQRNTFDFGGEKFEEKVLFYLERSLNIQYQTYHFPQVLYFILHSLYFS
jgi:hypothetical protein